MSTRLTLLQFSSRRQLRAAISNSAGGQNPLSTSPASGVAASGLAPLHSVMAPARRPLLTPPGPRTSVVLSSVLTL